MIESRRQRRERLEPESVADLGPPPAGYVPLDESEAAQILGIHGGATPVSGPTSPATPSAASPAGTGWVPTTSSVPNVGIADRSGPSGYVPLSEADAAAVLGVFGGVASQEPRSDEAQPDPAPAVATSDAVAATPDTATTNDDESVAVVPRRPAKQVAAQLSAENPIAPPVPLAEVAIANGEEPPDPWQDAAPTPSGSSSVSAGSAQSAASADSAVASAPTAPDEPEASSAPIAAPTPPGQEPTPTPPLSRKERLARRRAATGEVATRYPTRRELRATGALVILPAEDEPPTMAEAQGAVEAPQVPIPEGIVGYRTVDATGELSGVLPVASEPSAIERAIDSAPQPVRGPQGVPATDSASAVLGSATSAASVSSPESAPSPVAASAQEPAQPAQEPQSDAGPAEVAAPYHSQSAEMSLATSAELPPTSATEVPAAPVPIAPELDGFVPDAAATSSSGEPHGLTTDAGPTPSRTAPLHPDDPRISTAEALAGMDWPARDAPPPATGQVARVVTGQFPRPATAPKGPSFDEVIATEDHADIEPASRPQPKHLSPRQLALMVVFFVLLGLVIWFAVSQNMQASVLLLPFTRRTFKGFHDRI